MSNKANKPTAKSGYRQGYYKLINPDKYLGDPTKIIYRSSWEHKFCKYCDTTPAVLKWSSEPIGIKYVHPIDKDLVGNPIKRTYYVDFYMRLLKEDGSEVNYLVEIKPKASLVKPVLEGVKITTNKLKNYNYSLKTWLVNRSKFAAAKHYAEQNGYEFFIVTEDFLYGK